MNFVKNNQKLATFHGYLPILLKHFVHLRSDSAKNSERTWFKNLDASSLLDGWLTAQLFCSEAEGDDAEGGGGA